MEEIVNRKTPKISDKLIRRFFDKEISSGELDADLYQEVAENLSESLDSTIGIKFKYNEPDNILRAKLRTNLFAFSGAKSFAMFEEIRGELTNKDGSPRSFSEFKEKVLEIDLSYNTNWLKTEYNQAVVQSQHAKNWTEFEKDKDLYPNLRYVTVGDDRVRNDHRALDGIVRPVDDSFWNTYAPQNGWGCRCSLEQEDEDAQLTDKDAAQSSAKGVIKHKMFKTNVGKTGVVFKEDHPYFVSSKGIKQPLKAVKNYGMRTVVDIFNKPAKLSKYKNSINSKEEYSKWWKDMELASKEQVSGSFVMESKLSNKLLFNEKLNKKVEKAKDNTHLLADEMPLILSNPDEVWTQINKESFVTTYIKYYSDTTLILVSSPVSKTKEIVVTEFYKLDSEKTAEIEKYRVGVLEFRK